jgi:hypothetical protein
LALAIIIRLYPTAISGLPFSTDGWGCIRNTELLIQQTPVSLGNSSLFDGYNNYWPANSLFGAVFSEVTGLKAIDAMAIGIPLVGALTIPLFYILVRKITEKNEISLTAAVLLATAFPYTILTAGVTKETYANPLMLVVILAFLFAPSWKRTALFFLGSVALVMAHHLAALLTIGVLASLIVALSYGKDNKLGGTLKSNLGLLALISILTLGYFGVFALPGLTLSLVPSNLLTVGAYQISALSLAVFFISKSKVPSKKQVFVRFTAVFVATALFLFFITRSALVSNAPILPSSSLFYLFPYVLMVPLGALGLAGLYKRRSFQLVPLFWLIPLVGFGAYVLFSSSPMGLMLAYRTMNFVILPLVILAAIALYRLYTYSKALRLGKTFMFAAFAIALTISSINVYDMYATVNLQEPYLGSFWLYRQPEMAASTWIATYHPNMTVAGDAKVSYLLNGYYNMKVDVSGGLTFPERKDTGQQLLFVYPEMFTNGYVLFGEKLLTLPQNWTSNLVDVDNVYSNGMVKIYASGQ